MKKISLMKRLVLLLLFGWIIVYLPSAAMCDESLALYGLKGYTYTYSPLPSDGLNIQTGGMYSRFGGAKLNCRQGYVWAVPFSLTYGDGDRFEFAAASHWEYWENTDDYWDNKGIDTDNKGIGDVFLSAKIRLLGQEKGRNFPDVSLMPYILIPTDSRDKSIGDLYLYNPTKEDDYAYGVNLLIGKRWEKLYLAANLGFNYLDSDIEYIENSTYFFGLTFEYQVSESLTSYLEFINNQNKSQENYPKGSYCYDENTDEDIRELGLGFTWLTGGWGMKLHVGTGLSHTAPDIRAMALINRTFSF